MDLESRKPCQPLTSVQGPDAYNFAEPAPPHAKSPTHSKCDQTKNRVVLAKNCTVYVTEKTGKLQANVATFAVALSHRATSEARRLALRTARPAAFPMQVSTPNCYRRFAKVRQPICRRMVAPWRK